MRKWVSFLILLLVLSGIAFASGANKVLLVVADRYRNEELVASLEAVREVGLKPVIASGYVGTLHGMLGGEIRSDITLRDVNPEEYAAVIFVGGVGARVFWDDPLAHKIARSFHEKGKLVCAICIAPITLAKAGLLKGIKATCWKGVAPLLESLGAIYKDVLVVESDDIITASGPQAAEAFKKAIVRKLRKR